MDSSSWPGQSPSRQANKPNWCLTLQHANKPKLELPGRRRVVNCHGTICTPLVTHIHTEKPGLMDENFPCKPRFPGFSSDFRIFPEWVFKKIFFFSEDDPQFILSTLKYNSMTPKALKLHLQSITLQKSFYSSNFCYFTYRYVVIRRDSQNFIFFLFRPFSSL
jgi:hypothetical protein